MERMKLPFGWQVWGWFTLLASLGIHGYLLSLPMSFSLNAPEPEPEPIAAVPLTTLPEIPSPPPEPLVSEPEVSPTSEVMSIAEVYEPAASPQREVIQAVEVYESEVSPPSEVDLESESFDRTPSVSRDRNPQLPEQPAVDLEELRQQKIQSMKEQAARSSEPTIQNPNPENTPLNAVSEIFAQMDTDLDDFLGKNLQSGERDLYQTTQDILNLLESLSLNQLSDLDFLALDDDILKPFLLDDSGNFKEGIIVDKLRIITFVKYEDTTDITADLLYKEAIEPMIDSEKYQINNIHDHDVEYDINKDKIYEVEKKTTPKSPEYSNFYIQLIMFQSTNIRRKVAAIIVWDRQPEPLFPN